MDDSGGKELDVYQCIEKLSAQYPTFKTIQQIVYGYQSWERKEVEELARVHASSDPRNRREHGTDEQIAKKKNPYVRTEWQLCLKHPE